MRKSWLVLAVLLAGNVAVCRADGFKLGWRPLHPAATEAAVPAEAREGSKENGKDYVESIDAKDIAAAPATDAAPTSGAPCAASACCGHGGACAQHLWAWLTYRPLSRPGCCCHKCGGCHVPPLY